MAAKKALGKKAAKRSRARKAAAKKRTSAKKALGGTYIGTYLFCQLHGIRYPRGESCPRCS